VITSPLKEVAPEIAPATAREVADKVPTVAEVEYRLVEVAFVRVEFVEDKFDEKKLVEVEFVITEEEAKMFWEKRLLKRRVFVPRDEERSDVGV